MAPELAQYFQTNPGLIAGRAALQFTQAAQWST
jgi:hypothetical protein